jgi:hypothetical protein
MAGFTVVFSLSSGARRFFSVLRLTSLILLGIHSAIAFAQNQQTESAETKAAAPSSVFTAKPAMADYEQFAAYWTTEPDCRLSCSFAIVSHRKN